MSAHMKEKKMTTSMLSKRTSSEAARQMARYNLLTPAAVAERLQDLEGETDPKARITADTVRSWIEDERPAFRLRAIDMRSAGATRPRWFTEWTWVVECLERRSNMGKVDDAA